MSEIKLYQGDCLNVLQNFDNESIDLVVTSPPYDNLRTYNGNISTWSFEKFCQIANQLFRVMKWGGVIVWVVSDATINGSETGTSFRQALYFKDIGFNIHDTMIWEKDTFSFPCKNRYRGCFEYMFVFSKGKPKTTNLISDRKNKWCGMTLHGTSRAKDGTIYKKSNDKVGNVSEYGVRFNIWKIPTEKNNKTGHPAVYPLQIAIDNIISWSNIDDIVLDPFMGSGSTGIACINTDRNFIGIELDEKYFNIAKERIEKYKKEIL